ncbi:MAG: type II secretion system minor pseudopilin GspK [Zoogloeaceae bacterium]|jgi:general secretion pathway protein K|nr:type II secretion system minor pseudopilin GspK [Zoogloeaceae bacterium]
MKSARKIGRKQTRGAALLVAMLVVVLVASFATAVLWQQWRAVEVEAAERARAQSAWLLAGALDWSRLILREDVRTSSVDNLNEPWAVPLAEARLSSFLAADKNISSDMLAGLPDVFLSGRIADAQAKLNIANLIGSTNPASPAVAAFTKLFQLLGLPPADLQRLITGVQQASAANGNNGNVPLMPQRLRQLMWFGLSPQTIAALESHVTILPAATPLNVNTASAEVLAASLPSLDLSSAQRLVLQRTLRPFNTLAAAQAAMPESAAQLVEGQHSVNTAYFEVTGRLRLDKNWVEEHSLLRREDIRVNIVWRERSAGMTPPAGKPNPGLLSP